MKKSRKLRYLRGGTTVTSVNKRSTKSTNKTKTSKPIKTRNITKFASNLSSRTLKSALSTFRTKPTKITMKIANNSPNNLARVTKSTLNLEKEQLSPLFRNIFDTIRDTIKNYGNVPEKENPSDAMFLFGQPSSLINDLLFNLYQENLIRNDKLTADKNKGLQMMISCAMFDAENKTIYITTSEEPESDGKFFDKMGILIRMLIRILINNTEGISPGDEKWGREKKRNEVTIGNHSIEIIDILDKDLDIFRENPYLTSSYYESSAGGEVDVNGIIVDTLGPTRKIVRLKLPEDLKIKFIFNNEYNIMRRENGFSFEPFFKPDSKNPDQMACNSGSICSESKIFSYGHINRKNLKNSIAVWLGNGPFPKKPCDKGPGGCQYHPQYCYDKEHDEKILKIYDELIKTNNLSTQFVNCIENSKYILNNSTKNTIENKKIFLLRHFALPCPGCTLNWNRYNNYTFTPWNQLLESKCKESSKKPKMTRTQKVQDLMERQKTLYE